MSILSATSDKAAKWTIYIATILIVLAVVVLNQKILPKPETIPRFIYKLPALNAFLNGTCSLLLIFSYRAIRKKNIALHRKLNLAAFILSAAFLVSYVSAHYFIPDTKYGDINHDGIMSLDESTAVFAIKPVYLAILLTHILLAIIVLPLVLLSFYYGLTDQRIKHKTLTRFSFPVWLYVTITGVIVYFMISPYYNY